MQKGDANDSLSIEDEVEELVRIAAPLAPAIYVFMVRYPLIFTWKSQLIGRELSPNHRRIPKV
jgi:hypothetical protein